MVQAKRDGMSGGNKRAHLFLFQPESGLPFLVDLSPLTFLSPSPSLPLSQVLFAVCTHSKYNAVGSFEVCEWSARCECVSMEVGECGGVNE